ncbi:hypothetical protein BTE48_03995 [Oceanospirillum multiglobuliferum]|uniref:Uncharacterized protein n=1 Tax=Oceanospirillum multiglobuliferum TaxID=64969 RepID=A0A1V4T7L5_9GAMM|nr:hypothetical protein BTE48_03995 [Oceanospirillum multiglobuliferum]
MFGLFAEISAISNRKTGFELAHETVPNRKTERLIKMSIGTFINDLLRIKSFVNPVRVITRNALPPLLASLTLKGSTLCLNINQNKRLSILIFDKANQPNKGQH